MKIGHKNFEKYNSSQNLFHKNGDPTEFDKSCQIFYETFFENYEYSNDYWKTWLPANGNVKNELAWMFVFHSRFHTTINNWLDEKTTHTSYI